jgi:hypothetical protein
VGAAKATWTYRGRGSGDPEVILGVTSVLVQTTPARSAVAQNTEPTVQSATIKDKLYTLNIDVQPATVGLNDIHLYATTPDRQPADIKEWKGQRDRAPDQRRPLTDETVGAPSTKPGSPS